MIVFDLNSKDAEAQLRHVEEFRWHRATRARIHACGDALLELKEALVAVNSGATRSHQTLLLLR